MKDPNPPASLAFKTYVGYYKVTSSRFTKGKLGESVELELTDGERDALIEAGHIEVATRPEVVAKPEAKPAKVTKGRVADNG